MAWNDRLKEAAYTSPSGNRIVFTYETADQLVSKKTASFDFPDADGTYIQDLGHTGKRYPLRVIFWGDDHDLSANQFETALLEKGIGVLEHPIYGAVDVVPFGDIRFRNDLKNEANQTIIEVTFWQTIGLIYPTVQNSPANNVLVAIDDYNNSAAAAFEESLDVSTEVKKAEFKTEYTSALDSVSSGLATVASVQEDAQKQFNDVNDSISSSIDLLIGEPLALANQTLILIQAPARASALITDRLNAYQNLASTIIDDAKELGANDFLNRDLYASTYVTGSIVSVINNQFNTKTEALEAAESIIDQMDNLTTWRDGNLESLGVIDTGEAYQRLQEAVALTAGFLIEISFTLKQERKIILDKPYTIINFIAEVYPPGTNVDDEIDFFIQSNELTGSEILELPFGKEVVYYV